MARRKTLKTFPRIRPPSWQEICTGRFGRVYLYFLIIKIGIYFIGKRNFMLPYIILVLSTITQLFVADGGYDMLISLTFFFKF
jgi:hypothetical protein